MSKITDILRLIFKDSIIMKDSNLNRSPAVSNKPIISFKNAVIIGLIILACFISVLSLVNDPSFRMVFSDIASPVIEIAVAITLFYAVLVSGAQQKRVQIAWTILGIAVLSYAAGDSIWGIMELVIQQQPFPSIADVFYLAFYPLFVFGIYYLPEYPLSRNELSKLIIDTAVLFVTLSLILWSFLVMPGINSNNELLANTISIAYIAGDIVLLFALIKILFIHFKNIYYRPLILLGLAIVTKIISDSFYSYLSIQGAYISGGLLDTGWIIGIIFIGLAAILQANDIIYSHEHLKFGLKKFSFSPYLPLLSVAVAFILLLWANYNLIFPDDVYIEIGIGIIVFLVLFRQAVTLNENKDLYQTAKKEIKIRKIAEKDLIETKNRFQSIFDNAPIGIYHSSPEGKLYLANQNLSSILGYRSPEEFITKVNKSSIGDLVWRDKEKRLEVIEEALNDDLWHTNECMFYKKDGGIIVAELTMKSIRDDDDSVEYLEGFIMDITDHKKAGNALKTSENYYRTIFENTGTATIIIEDDMTISLVNSKFEEFSGYRRGELESKKGWMEFIANKEDGERIKEYHHLRRTDPKSAPKNYEFKLVDKYGAIKDVFVTASMIPGTNKSLISLIDITDKIKSRKELRESKAKLKIAMDLSKLVQWEYDVESDLFTFDDQFYKLYGTSVEKEGKTQMSSEEYARKFIPPEEFFLVAEEVAKALETNDPNYFSQIEHSIIRADGEKRFIIVRMGVIKDDKGRTIKTFGANQDITELKQAENDLKASLEEKEILLKEVHHRVKNNMQIISSLLNLQLASVDDDQAIGILRESQGRIKSMALVHENLYLSDVLSRINFKGYIHKLVRDLLMTYKAQFIDLKLNIEDIYLNIETAIPCGLIINELVTNCIKYAFPENNIPRSRNSKFSILTTSGQGQTDKNSKGSADGFVSQEVEDTIVIEFIQNEDKFTLIVSDNGIGLPESYEDSKSLGLRLVRILVNQLDGVMEIDRDNGTTFTIIFKELSYKRRV